MQANFMSDLAPRARRLRLVTMASLGLVTALIALGMFAAFSGRTDPSLAFSFALGADNDRYRWAAMIVIFMTGLPFSYALWRLSRMLSCVERGEVFSGGSVSHLRAFALWVFVSAVASIVLPLLVNSAFGLIGGLPADRLRLDFDGSDLFILLVSGLLFFVARLLESAQRIADDLRQIV